MKRTYLAAICLLLATTCKAQGNKPFPELKLFDNFYGKMALDEHGTLPADTNLIAIWKMKEDADPHNYFVVERRDYNDFVATYMNRSGSNRTYENFTAFFSKVGNIDVINVIFRDYDAHIEGYFFLKVISIEKGGWGMTLALVDDPELKNIADRSALRDRMAKDISNPKYCKNPVHFRKILPLMYCK